MHLLVSAILVQYENFSFNISFDCLESIRIDTFRYLILQDKDQEQFTKQLLYYLGAFAGGIPVSILLLSSRY